jgi:hypothetical protein
MLNIKKILRERLEEISEAAKNISHLPETAGLFIPTENYLVLYDAKFNEIYGIISLWKSTKSDMKYYSVGAVAAESGFGPLMYELGMSHVFPNGITPDRDSSLTPSAEKIYIQMANRGDIKKEPIKAGDADYASQYHEDYLQQAYFFNDKTTYNKLKAIGDTFAPKINMEKLLNKAENYFDKKLS